MKIVFLIDKVFSDRDYDRFGIDFFIKKLVKIEIWDFRVNIEKNQNNDYEADTKKIIFKNFYSDINKDLETKRLNNYYIFDLRVGNLDYFNLTFFKKKNANLIKIEQMLHPVKTIKMRYKILYLLKKFKLLIIFRIIKKLINFSKNKEKIMYDIKICSGKKSNLQNAKNIIYSHSLDYDIFLNLDKDKKMSNSNNIVFIDNGMCDHPDYKLLSIPSYATSEKYYPSMNHFFNAIEKYFNEKVVIAGHPKILNNQKLRTQFENREIIFGKTPELIRDSKLIICHDSTAINFAVLWNKPLIFVSTNEIMQNNYLSMQSIKDALNIKCINVDSQYKGIDWDKLAKKSLLMYSDYKKDYIKTSQSKNQYSWKIFLDFIENNKLYNKKIMNK